MCDVGVVACDEVRRGWKIFDQHLLFCFFKCLLQAEAIRFPALEASQERGAVTGVLKEIQEPPDGLIDFGELGLQVAAAGAAFCRSTHHLPQHFLCEMRGQIRVD
ncbi:hypothetical protein [Loktanella salsilacus]|uniref:hypothetical protein n=1 Tax=Loktanella salsilacus TaxID=195913 RepID=UPI0020B86589|nr:hypothetical protein [Loktanella salsilacus]UTH46631.1 hypothetical protein KBK07_17150 [Loktanella salsilacus]